VTTDGYWEIRVRQTQGYQPDFIPAGRTGFDLFEQDRSSPRGIENSPSEHNRFVDGLIDGDHIRNLAHQGCGMVAGSGKAGL
jgi:hypothetical protein